MNIAEGLQQAIFEHRLLPGTKLSEDEVGQVYGVSRTLVRSALQKLAHEHLVTIRKNKGAFVAQPSIRDAHEVFEARSLMEPRVAAMAARNMNAQHLQHLKRHIELEHEALASGKKGKALALSGTFHLEIADIAAHDVFTEFLKVLVKRSSLIIALYWKRSEVTCEHHSHEALLKAFAEGKAEEAEAIMRSHIVDLHSGLDLTQKRETPMSLSEALTG